MLYWLAAARARSSRPRRGGAVLVDLGCGGGLLAPHIRDKGYRHVGVDLIGVGLEQAAAHGVRPCSPTAAVAVRRQSVDVVVRR